jgi:hypothetical protein
MVQGAVRDLDEGQRVGGRGMGGGIGVGKAPKRSDALGRE